MNYLTIAFGLLVVFFAAFRLGSYCRGKVESYRMQSMQVLMASQREYGEQLEAATDTMMEESQRQTDYGMLHSINAATLIDILDHHLSETDTTLGNESMALLDTIRPHYERQTFH